MNLRRSLSRYFALALLCSFAYAGPMATSGQFEVSPTGAATYTIPLSVPPGTAGIEPKLSLVYNSQAGNGLLGVGWSLSGLSVITRCPRTMAQDGVRGGINFDANDRFCLDGQRLMAVSGSYGADGTEYRTERESFSKVVSYGSAGSGPAWFKVWTKAGQILEYGNTADSRIEAQGKASARVWALNRLSDTKGNYFTVAYNEDNANGDYSPARIDYTGNAGLAPNNSVQFVYEARPDSAPLFQAGSLLKNAVRLTHVQTYSGSTLLKDYATSYSITEGTRLSRLVSLSECDGANACLPSTRFNWQDGTVADMIMQAPLGALAAAQGYSDTDQFPVVTGDWNGDGRIDIARVGPSEVIFQVSTPSGYLQSSVLSNLAPAQGFSSDSSFPLVTGDWNADGKTDIARIGAGGMFFYISTDAGFVPYTTLNDFSPVQGFTSRDRHPILVGDWNGDGRTDIARVGEGGVYSYLNTGLGFASAPVLNDLAPTQGFTSGGGLPIISGDWNGDGKTDIARFGEGGVFFYAATDAGFAFHSVLVNLAYAQGFTSMDRFPILLGDWNGDGKTDIGRVAEGGVILYLSTGTDFIQQPPLIGLSPTHGYVSASSYPLVTGDWNGDGKTDIARFAEASVSIFTSGPSGFNWSQSLLNLSSAQGFVGQSGFPILTGDWTGIGKSGIGRFSEGAFIPYAAGNGNTDLLLSVTQGLGATATAAYAPLTVATVYARDTGTISYPQLNLQVPLNVVSSATRSNGLGGTVTANYVYGGAKASQDGRGLLGFRWIEAVQAETGVTTRTEYRQDWPYVGLPSLIKKTATSGGNGGLLNQTTHSYGCLNPQLGSACVIAAGNRYFPYVSQSVESGWDLSGTALPTVTTANTFDTYGNATQIAVTTSDGISKTTTNTYQNDVTNWFLGRNVRSTVSSLTPDSAPPVSPPAPPPQTVEYLVVAGGGGGGGSRNGSGDPGGGGGAGGFRTGTLAVAAGTYTVTVGSGGAGGAPLSGGGYGAGGSGSISNGSNGSDSVFGPITATGGGYGRGDGMATSGNGGSGGGGASNRVTTAGSGNSPSTSPSQGTSGGAGSVSSAGGGGGASAAGTAASFGSASPGGAGMSSSITGSAVTYAGGGGGGVYSSAGVATSAGGSGGGGNGGANGNSGNPTNGTANTGGGGGGSGGGYSGSTGGNGGSGIVIIRYPDTYDLPAATTGAPEYSNVGGYHIYQWKTVGTGSITFGSGSSSSPPTLTAVSPNTGPVEGGTSVTLTGTGFAAGATVLVGGNAASGCTVASSTSITCTTPAGSAGAADVVVGLGGSNATLAGGFTYVGSGNSLSLAILANTANYNVKSAALAAGWIDTTPLIATVTVNSGVIVFSNSTTAAAFDTGTGYPTGSALKVINNGSIIGAGGVGGAGGDGSPTPQNGSPGSSGGIALNTSINITVDNTNGNIFAGGGGGGGGGGAYTSIPTSDTAGGGGGGGGAGHAAGIGGAGGRATGGQDGSAGASGGTAGGNPGTGYSLNQKYAMGSGWGGNGTGGNNWGGMGGGYGQNGEPGGNGIAFNGASYVGVSSGGAGGLAGNAIKANGSSITWLGGNNAGQVKGAVQ